MLRLVPVSILVFSLVSCEKPTEKPSSSLPGSATDPAKKDGSPSTGAKAPEESRAALPDLRGAADKAKAEGEAALGDLKKATASTAEKVQAVPATAKEAAKDAVKNLPDLSKVAEPSFTLEKLKEMVNSLSPDDLKGLADKLSAAISNKEGVIKGLKEQIASLGAADLGKAGDMKKSLDGAALSLTDLKEKLKVVLDKLKGAGTAK
jgi:hypothetical protein